MPLLSDLSQALNPTKTKNAAKRNKLEILKFFMTDFLIVKKWLAFRGCFFLFSTPTTQALKLSFTFFKKNLPSNFSLFGPAFFAGLLVHPRGGFLQL
jgi:hypothetical protein